MAAHLEELSIVHDQPNQLARVIAAATVGRDDVQQLLGATVRRITGFHARRDIVGSVRQVGYEGLNLLEGVLFRLGFVVHLSALMDMSLVSSQFFLVHLLTDGAAHDGRA